MKVSILVARSFQLYICAIVCTAYTIELNQDQHIKHYAWLEKLLTYLNAPPAYESNQLPDLLYKATSQGFLLEINEDTNYLHNIITPWGKYKPSCLTNSISKCIQTKFYKREKNLRSNHAFLQVTHIEDNTLPEAQEIHLTNILNLQERSEKLHMWQYLQNRIKKQHNYHNFEILQDLLFELKGFSSSSLEPSYYRTLNGIIIEADKQYIRTIYVPWGKFNIQNVSIEKKVLLRKNNHTKYTKNKNFQTQYTLYALTYVHDQKISEPTIIHSVSEMNQKKLEYDTFLTLYKLLSNQLPRNNLQDLCIEKISRYPTLANDEQIDQLPAELQTIIQIHKTLNSY